jgi:hypothetical protein
VHQIDPEECIGIHSKRLPFALHYRTGFQLIQSHISNWLKSKLAAAGSQVDLCWIDGGELIGPGPVDVLRTHARKIVLFNHDDPTGQRDWRRFSSLRNAIPRYDLCAVVRKLSVAEWQLLGARQVVRVWMSCDEVAHCAEHISPDLVKRFESDIAFLGRCMNGEGRDDLIVKLIEAGLHVSIWGDNWSASKHWARLRPYWRGSTLKGDDYIAAIRGARICLGLLSKGNRDLHTTRSMEIPYIGSVLCAERTSEHLELYDEGKDAVFWRDHSECVRTCRELLSNSSELERIRRNGFDRVRRNKVASQDLCTNVLAALQ